MEQDIEELVANFLRETCQLNATVCRVIALYMCPMTAASTHGIRLSKAGIRLIAKPSGSASELHIEPMRPCIDDFDMLVSQWNQLATPRGHSPPTKLSDDFSNCVIVYEMTDTDHPGYVCLEMSSMLTRRPGEDYRVTKLGDVLARSHQIHTYGSASNLQSGAANSNRQPNIVCQCSELSDALIKHRITVPSLESIGRRLRNGVDSKSSNDSPVRDKHQVDKHMRKFYGQMVRGPTIALKYKFFQQMKEVYGADLSFDHVRCMRCLSWPDQAAEWLTRSRHWPDSATVQKIIGNGCDHVPKPHAQSSNSEYHYQWRLSFSRAETVLLNSCTVEQQLVYHVLRTFVKREKLTGSSSCELSGYHVKTLMMWACEIRHESWWETNSCIADSVVLLLQLGEWVSDGEIPHYFINGCNLLLLRPERAKAIVTRLEITTAPRLANWFLSNYIRFCFCINAYYPGQVFETVSEIRHALSLVATLRCDYRLKKRFVDMEFSVYFFTHGIFFYSIKTDELTVTEVTRYWLQLKEIDARLFVHATAVWFLQIVRLSGKAPNASWPKYDSLLFAVMSKLIDSSSCSLNRALTLPICKACFLLNGLLHMKIDTLKLKPILLELAKFYVQVQQYETCKECSIDCKHCKHGHQRHTSAAQQYPMNLQSVCNCEVNDELISNRDGLIDTVVGLTTLYRFVQAKTLEGTNTVNTHCRRFTADVFVYYLLTKAVHFCPDGHHSSSDFPDDLVNEKNVSYNFCHYSKRLTDTKRTLLVSDVLLYKYLPYFYPRTSMNARRVDGTISKAELMTFEPTRLLRLLRESAVEHLTEFRSREQKDCGSDVVLVTDDFLAMQEYAVRRYERCAALCYRGLRALTKAQLIPSVLLFPEFLQFLHGDLISLVGLTLLVNRSLRNEYRYLDCIRLSQMTLLLYMYLECCRKTQSMNVMVMLKDARRYIVFAQKLHTDRTLDQLALVLMSRKLAPQ